MKKTLALLSLSAFILSASAQTLNMPGLSTSVREGEVKLNINSDDKKSEDRTKPVATTWTAEKGQCMASAVEKRDNSIISAVDTFNAAIKSALGVRKDAVKAVWNTADSAARQTARKSAEATFKTSVKAAHEKVRSDRKAAWSTFDSDANTCGFKNHGEKLEIVNVPVAY